jgi:hypothetical protein
VWVVGMMCLLTSFNKLHPFQLLVFEGKAVIIYFPSFSPKISDKSSNLKHHVATISQQQLMRAVQI